MDDLEARLRGATVPDLVRPTGVDVLRRRVRTRRLHRTALGVGVAIVLVAAGAASAVLERDESRVTARPASEPPRANADHWHVAYGLWVCDRYLDALEDERDPLGIHSHADGIIHVHPFTQAASGRGATLAKFFDAVRGSAGSGVLDVPGRGIRSDGDECDGQRAIVRIVVWSSDGQKLGEYSDAADVRLVDRQSVTIAFAPASTDIAPPPSRLRLDDLDPMTDEVVDDPSIDEVGTVMPPSPLALRSSAALVWTGAEVVVWGGDLEGRNTGIGGPDVAFNDGAAFSPATRQWRLMARSPLPRSAEPAVGVRTDAGILLARSTSAALWNPTSNQWTLLPPAPEPLGELYADGDTVVSARANVALDLTARRWRRLPEPPLRFDRSTTSWTGSDLVVVGGPGPDGPTAAIAYRPSEDAWRRLPDPPKALESQALAATWDGTRAIVVNYDMVAVAFDPAANSWTALPAIPARFSEWGPTLVNNGAHTVAFMSNAIAVLGPEGRWTPLPYGEVVAGRTTVGSGPGNGEPLVYTWGLRLGASPSNVLATFDPNVATTSGRFQVGAASIEVPAGFRLDGATFEEPGTSSEVRVTLSHPERGTCAAAAITAFPAPSSRGTEEVLTNDGQPRSWFHVGNARTWRTPASETDGFEVTCAHPVDTRAIATSASFIP